MPSIEDTIAQFYQGAAAQAPADPAGATSPADPVGIAIDTLRNFAQPQPQFAPGLISSPATGPAQAAPAPAPYQPPPNTAPALQPDATTQAAPATPAPPAPSPYALPKPPASLDDANRQYAQDVSGAGQTAADAADAQFNATQDHQSRLADIAQRSSEDQARLQQQFQVDRQRNEADADMETAAWVQDLQTQAAKEPNPARWWENQSTLGKALWAIGLVFGAANAAITPGAKNVALELVRSSMANDMEEQRQRLGKQLEALKTKGLTMRERQGRLASDLADDRTMGLSRIEAMERAFTARATVPGDLDAQAGKLQAQAAFAQMKLPYIEAQRKELLDAKNAELARRHEMRMLGSRQAFEDAQRIAGEKYQLGRDAIQHQYKLEESPVSLGAGAGYTPGGPIPTNKDGVPIYAELQSGINAPSAGLVLKGPDGKPANGAGVIRVRPDDKKEAGHVIETANIRYTATQSLLDLLEGTDPGLLEGVAGVMDPQLQSRIKELGYAIATSHDKRVTNADFSNGVEEGMGFDPNGNWLSRGKFTISVDAIKQKLRDDLNAMPKKVSESMRQYNDAAINGQGTEIVWDPHNLVGDKVREKTSTDIEGAPDTVPLPKTVGAYQKAQADSATDASRPGLPPLDRAAVDSIIYDAKGRGPSTIEASAKARLDKVYADLTAVGQRLNQIDAYAKASTYLNDVDSLDRSPHAIDPTTAEALKHPPASTAEWTRLKAKYDYLKNTYEVGSSVAADASARATKTIKAFETWAVDAKKRFPWMTDDTVRTQAQKRFGLTDADTEVRRVLDRVHGTDFADPRED